MLIAFLLLSCLQREFVIFLREFLALEVLSSCSFFSLCLATYIIEDWMLWSHCVGPTIKPVYIIKSQKGCVIKLNQWHWWLWLFGQFYASVQARHQFFSTPYDKFLPFIANRSFGTLNAWARVLQCFSMKWKIILDSLQICKNYGHYSISFDCMKMIFSCLFWLLLGSGKC